MVLLGTPDVSRRLLPKRNRVTRTDGAKAGAALGFACAANGACPVASSGPVSLIYSPGTGFTGNSNFRFTGGQFQFNWDTSTASATGPGCYTLLMQLKDTTVKTLSIRLQ